MNFRRLGVFVLAQCVAQFAMGQDQPPSTISVGGVAFARPLILRSDFVSKDILRRFMIRSRFSDPVRMAKFIGKNPGIGRDWFGLDYVKECRRFIKGELLEAPTPKLKGGTIIEVAEGFDRFGGSRWPKGKVIMTRRIHFWEREFEKKATREVALRKWATQEVARNPEYYRGKLLGDEYIDKCIESVKKGGYVKTNPIDVNGDMCHFHHAVGPTKKFEVISYKEHRLRNTISSKGHASGTPFSGGGNKTWQVKPTVERVWSATASRWGGIAGVDLALSSAALIAAETRDKNDYIVNAGSVAAAYLSATITESVMVNAFSLSAGTTPAWCGCLSVGVGGAASWFALGVYFVVRSAVMYGWKKYQLQQAKRVEEACRTSEQAARRMILSGAIRDNSEKLIRLVRR